MSMRYFSTMPHPLPSSRGINRVSHYLLVFVQDWHVQLCAKSYANPKSGGPLPTLRLQGSSVSFKILLWVLCLFRKNKGNDYALWLDDNNFNLHGDKESPTKDKCLSRLKKNTVKLLFFTGLRFHWTTGGKIPFSMPFTASCTMLGL